MVATLLGELVVVEEERMKRIAVLAAEEESGSRIQDPGEQRGPRPPVGDDEHIAQLSYALSACTALRHLVGEGTVLILQNANTFFQGIDLPDQTLIPLIKLLDAIEDPTQWRQPPREPSPESR